jgi:polyprenyl-phospho-N-acetylgalactosaminyl synthase
MILALIPAYNEARRIGDVIRGVLPQVDRVIVIDDASIDNTADIARAAGAVVISHVINRGQGAALETGHAYARAHGASMVVHFDGDGQFDPAQIPMAIAHLHTHGADMVLGTRYALGSHNDSIPWVKRHVVHPLASMFHRLFFRFSFSDAHNGFRVLSRVALDSIVITQDRMAHATEIPALALRRGLGVVEFPVSVRYYTMGQKPSSAFRILVDLFFGWMRGKSV